MGNHNHKHDDKKHEHENQDHADKKNEEQEVVAPSEPVAEDVADIEVKVPASEEGKNGDSDLTKANDQIDVLKSQVAASNDKYLRLMAEFDNFKRRTSKEYQQLIELANERLMKDVVDVRENFERAFKSHKEGSDPAAFIEGMRLTFAKLDSVLSKHGLEVYCEAGQPFSPELHDAMMKTAHESVPEEHISEVLEKGYKLKGKVIKHSRVIVSSGCPAPVVPEKQEEEFDLEGVKENADVKDEGK